MKHILITGATSGIGETTARFYNQNHDDVSLILIGRREDKLKKMIEEFGEDNYYIVFDFAGEQPIGDIFEKCHEWKIKLDGLVHCAGIGAEMPVRSIDMDLVRQAYEVSTFSFLELGKYFSKKKYTNDGASIVTMTSYVTRLCNKGMIAYASSKSAIETSLKIMAKELVSRKIRVNGVAPSFVDTPLISESVVEERAITGGVLQKYGIIPPEQVAYLVDFLMSERAAYITGEVIGISGGVE